MSEATIIKRKECIDEGMVRAIEKIAENTYLSIQKKDFRATTVTRTEQGEVPSDVAAFLHFDESLVDNLGSPIELDIKGTITTSERYSFEFSNFAMMLTDLRDWKFFESEREERDGSITIIKTPIKLAQEDMNVQKRLNLSRMGAQSEKHIRALRANSGREEDGLDRISKFMGWRKEPKGDDGRY